MDIKTAKDQYYAQQAQIFKIMGSPLRLQILQFISFAPRTVEDCAYKFSQSIQNISLHLITLQKAGMLEVLKVKNYRYYYLAEGEKRILISKILNIDPTSLLANDHLYLEGIETLLNEVRKGITAIVDLRSLEEINYIPLNNVISFQEDISLLPSFIKSKSNFSRFVFICKGRMCERLAESVKICLRDHLPVKALALSSDELITLFNN